jgi:hypothetical protein
MTNNKCETSHFLEFSIREKLSVIVLLIAATVIRLRHLDSPISGTYSFRTTQTAWGIRSFVSGNYSPLSIEMPVLGPPWRVPFEFPLYQMIAGITSKVFGLSVEASGRIVTTCFFVASGFVFYLLIRRFVSMPSGLFALVVFLFNAHGLEYGKAVLIDYCALFFALTAFLFALKYLAGNKPMDLYFFIIATVLAGLVKITTSIVWVIIGTIIAGLLVATSRWLQAKVFTLALVGHIPAIIWTWWADREKSRSTTTEWLTSSNLREWNFGSISQRISYSHWENSIFKFLLPSLIGVPLIAVLLCLMAVAFVKNIRLVAAFGGLFLAGPLLFSNLYIVHEYYWICVIPALLGLLAVAVDVMLTKLQSGENSSVFRGSVIALSLSVCLVLASWGSPQGKLHFSVWRDKGTLSFDDENERIAIETISQETMPSDRIILLGRDWNPSILYYADRKGLMIPPAVDPSFLRDSRDLGSLYQFVYFYYELDPAAVKALFGNATLQRVTGNLFRFIKA